MGEELLTSAQAAKYLDVAQGTLRDYRQLSIILPCDRSKTGKGTTYLYKKSDLDELKTKRVWANPGDKTRRGHSAYRPNAERSREDETHESGCIIHWSQRSRQGKITTIPITCTLCKNVFTKRESCLLQSISMSEFTGCCPNCYRKHRKPQYMRSNGYIRMADGYIRRHVRSFSKEEQKLLYQMNLNGGIYILEHRAVMALHLKRPLSPDEVVHHLNGRKNDNRIENLELKGAHEHVLEHTETIHRILTLEAENTRLKHEIERLQSTLKSNHIFDTW